MYLHLTITNPLKYLTVLINFKFHTYYDYGYKHAPKFGKQQKLSEHLAQFLHHFSCTTNSDMFRVMSLKEKLPTCYVTM